MEKEIYISIDITDFGDGYVRCEMLQSVDDGPLEATKLDINKAHKLIWELVLAGGKRSYRTNYLDRTIVNQSAYIFLPN